MTERDINLIFLLRQDKIDLTEFAKEFSIQEPLNKLAGTCIKNAILNRNSVMLEYSIILGCIIGVDESMTDHLHDLLFQEWHYSHEDIISLISDNSSQTSIPTLAKSIDWALNSITLDNGSAIAMKALWALANISGPEADEVLLNARSHPNPDVSNLAWRLTAGVD